MRTFLHSFRITARRFRWELLAFIVLSLGISLAVALGKVDLLPHSVPFFKFSSGLAALEKAVAVWIILRLMCSVPVLLTEGGWRTRPIPRWVAMGSSAAVLASVLLLSLLARLWVTGYSVSPDAGQWLTILRRYILPDAFTVVVVATILRVAASLAPNRQGAGKRLRLVLVGLIALVSWTWLLSTVFLPGRDRDPAVPTTYDGRDDLYRAAIWKLLPEDADLIGQWNHQGGWPTPMREALRIPMQQDLVIRRPGLEMKLHLDHVSERNLLMELSIISVEGKIQEDLWRSAMVIRYPGNRFALSDESPKQSSPPELAFHPVTGARMTGRFPPPSYRRMTAEAWEETLSGSELIFFCPDPTLPQFKVEADYYSPPSPGWHLPNAEGVKGIFTSIDFAFDTGFANDQEPYEWEEQVKKLGASDMKEILSHEPWSDQAWKLFVKPYLLEYATEADKAALQERLRDDPRIGEIFIPKDWKADAMPLLRDFAKDRLPMGLVSVTALLEEKDPALGADLGSLLMRLEEGDEVAQLEPLLKEYPGLNWEDFVRRGWKFRKYSLRRQGPLYPFDLWAARLGDATAFRMVGEQAAREEDGYEERLRSLVAGEHADIIAYIRENLAKMKFDAASGKWGL